MDRTRYGIFFSPLYAFLGVAVLGVGVVAGHATYAKYGSGVISIRGGMATAAMAFVGLALLTRTFARGCRRCRRVLDTARIDFPPDTYPALEGALARGETGLAELRALPAPARPDRVAMIYLQHCPGCRALGSAQVFDQQLRGDGYATRQKGAEKDLSAGEIAVLVGILDSRAQAQPIAGVRRT